MLETFSRLIALILLVIGLFIYPILLIFETQDELSRTVVLSEAVKFVENASSKGKITENMLLVLKHDISRTNNVYDIKITHYKYLDYDNIESDLINDDYIINTNEQIIKEIDEIGIYNLSSYDLIELEIINKNKTLATKIQEVLYNTEINTSKIYVRYGGIVRNET